MALTGVGGRERGLGGDASPQLDASECSEDQGPHVFQRWSSAKGLGPQPRHPAAQQARPGRWAGLHPSA
jgi:hypothetical protein